MITRRPDLFKGHNNYQLSIISIIIIVIIIIIIIIISTATIIIIIIIIIILSCYLPSTSIRYETI